MDDQRIEHRRVTQALGVSDYEGVTDLDWFGYELATIEYDYRVHPDAIRRILEMAKRLYEREN